jgi:hypothetical protein
MDHRAAAAKRDLGIDRAIDGALSDDPLWADWAYLGLVYFLADQRQPFLTEQVREFCEREKCVDPPANARAWGHIMRSAMRNGLIEKIGYAPARSSNLSPKVLWKAIDKY